jgi:hypothetical protein
MYYTQAAQTIAAAEQTRAAASTPTPEPATPTPTDTPTLPPTLPPISGPSATPDPCNQAQFLYDVTIPDNTIMSPNQTFTKTWELRNIGACPWTTDYKLVFVSGTQMGGVTTQLLTQGSILRGQSVDASVVLKAPATAGTYTGYWKLADGNGHLFGLAGDPFYVTIKVVTSGTITIRLGTVAYESGSVTASGTVSGDVLVGDTANKEGVQGFLSFDISTISSRATINSVMLDLSQYDITGVPFTGLGCLDVYQQDYTPLNANDFVNGNPVGAFIEWCNSDALNAAIADNDFTTALQARLGTGTRLQFRLQFPNNHSNRDGMVDAIRFYAPTLIVQFTMP